MLGPGAVGGQAGFNEVFRAGFVPDEEVRALFASGKFGVNLHRTSELEKQLVEEELEKRRAVAAPDSGSKRAAFRGLMRGISAEPRLEKSFVDARDGRIVKKEPLCVWQARERGRWRVSGALLKEALRQEAKSLRRQTSGS